MSDMTMPLTKDDLKAVLRQMIFYNRTEGYIEFVDEKIMFFDSMPSFGGAHVTREQMQGALELMISHEVNRNNKNDVTLN